MLEQTEPSGIRIFLLTLAAALAAASPPGEQMSDKAAIPLSVYVGDPRKSRQYALSPLKATDYADALAEAGRIAGTVAKQNKVSVSSLCVAIYPTHEGGLWDVRYFPNAAEAEEMQHTNPPTPPTTGKKYPTR